MSSDYNNPAFKKLLQRLQEESWQLELIISGFAIFGLFTAFEPISNAVVVAQSKQQLELTIIMSIAVVSCAILIFNLLLHVVLRGLWIGTLGLRYVSGDIDYDSLNYSQKFTTYLKKRVGSFDKYIATLENYCSIIFAVSFLLIFYVLALTFTIITIIIIATQIIDNSHLPETLRSIVGIIMIVFVIFGMILTFIDFITQGWLKKKKWISKIYFPIYWVFSFITLSFLYRPLVYNFLDNKFGRRLSFVLLPVYILILILTSFKYNPSNYFDSVDYSSEIMASRLNYIDMIGEKEHIDRFAISSKVVSTPYLNVFMELTDTVENDLFNFNPDLKPEDDQRGLKTNMIMINEPSAAVVQKQQKTYLETLNLVYSIKIDSIYYDAEFIVSDNKQKDLGFETYIGLKDLKEGKHVLKVIRKRIKKEDTVKYAVSKIPFWYFKD